MPVIAAVVTAKAREVMPKNYAGQLTLSEWTTFKVGEGGWVDAVGGPVRRTPSAAYTTIDALDGSRSLLYATDSRASFSKTLIPADFTFTAPSTMEVRCLLDFGEFNDDGFGHSPEIWELGVFDGDGNMVAYATFPKQIKDNTKQLENIVKITF